MNSATSKPIIRLGTLEVLPYRPVTAEGLNYEWKHLLNDCWLLTLIGSPEFSYQINFDGPLHVTAHGFNRDNSGWYFRGRFEAVILFEPPSFNEIESNRRDKEITQTTEDWPKDRKVEELISWLLAKLEEIPQEYRPTAKYFISAGDYEINSYSIMYYRPETDQEVAKRLAPKKTAAGWQLVQERLAYEQLKAKFEPKAEKPDAQR